MATLTAEYLADLGRVRLTAGDLVPNITYQLQRSINDGLVWVDVRGGSNISDGGITVVSDYEYVPNVENLYRLVGPSFYDAFDRVYLTPITEDFEDTSYNISFAEGPIAINGARLPGGAGNYMNAPGSTGLQVSSSTFVADVALDDYSAANNQVLIAKWVEVASQRSYRMFITTTGQIRVQFSFTGTTADVDFTTTQTVYDLGYADGDRIILRVVRTFSNGLINVYHKTAGDLDANITATWTLIQSTTLATGLPFDSTAPISIGADQGGTANITTGYVFAVLVTDSTSLTSSRQVFPRSYTQAAGTTSFTDDLGVAWDLEGTAVVQQSSTVLTSDAPWARTNAQAHTGSWSLGSGSITHSQGSNVVFTLPPDASALQFWGKIDSEAGFDFFQLFVDGQLIFMASGDVDWDETAVIGVAAASTFSCRYVKDTSVSSGADAVWIDDITLTRSDGTWGTATTGQLWQSLYADTNAFASVNNGVASVGAVAPIIDGDDAFIGQIVNGAGALDSDARWSSQLPQLFTNSVQGNIALRASGTVLRTDFTGYIAQWNFLSTGEFSVRIAKFVSGVFVTIPGEPSTIIGTWNPNVPWHFRFQVDNSNIRLKAWEEGATQPTQWTLEAVDTEIVSGDGVGMYAFSSGASTELLSIDWLQPLAITSIPAGTAATTMITPEQAETLLKSLQYPSLNQEMECVDWDEQIRDSRAGFYDIKGRHEILAITDVGSSATFNLSFVTRSVGATRAMVALLTFGGTLYLQPPGDAELDCHSGTFSGTPEGYVVPSGSVQAHSVHGQPIWGWNVNFTRVAPPDPEAIIPTTITWKQLWEILGPNGTWNDVWATWPSWQALWAEIGIGNPV